MTDQYLRLAERPALRHPGYPTCDACDIETDHEDGDWLCPSCRTHAEGTTRKDHHD